MTPWIDRLLANRTTHALELSAQFAEARHRVLAENAANVDTPDYVSQRLDADAFAGSLRTALDEAGKTNATRLELRGNAQFEHDDGGRLVVQPVEEPAQNVLFHDGTNAHLERLMGDVASNSLAYEMSTALLRGRFETMLRAIRGRTA